VYIANNEEWRVGLDSSDRQSSWCGLRSAQQIASRCWVDSE